MKRLVRLLANVALIRMLLAALQNTVAARRVSVQEARQIKMAENEARCNWQAWQQARAEAEHWQQANERAKLQRIAWQQARDQALALQQARERAAQQRYATAQNRAHANAEWLQVTADETQQTVSNWGQKLWAMLVLADRLGAGALDEAGRGVAHLQKSVVKSKQVKAVRRSLMQTWAEYGWGEARARRIARQRRMQSLNAVALGAGVGAIAWYFLDPETGGQHRAQFRDRLMGFAGNGQTDIGSSMRDGLPVQTAHDLSAPVAASGQSQPMNAFADMYHSGPSASSGSLASGLTGGAAGATASAESWPLGVRVLAGLAGGVLMVTGLGFRGVPGIGGRAVGAGLLVRALTNMPFSRLARPNVSPPIDIVNPAHSGDLDVAARGSGLDPAGERAIPLGQWQAFFDDTGRAYGDRIVVVERANGMRIAELPLLGASVDLRPDGRDVRLLLGAGLGTHMDHLVEDVRSLIALPGRDGERGFRLEAADGATTVYPLNI